MRRRRKLDGAIFLLAFLLHQLVGDAAAKFSIHLKHNWNAQIADTDEAMDHETREHHAMFSSKQHEKPHEKILEENVNGKEEDELHKAMEYSRASSDPGKKQPVIVVLADGLMARMHLPIFMGSIQDVGISNRVVVYNLDAQAHEICLTIHHPRLCATEFGSQEINGAHVPVMYDEENGLGSWYHKGWMKTSLTLKTLLLGYDVMFMDIDMLVFHNPFSAIDPEADVAVTVDCHEYYTPHQDSREEGGPNLGLTFFRSNQMIIDLVTKWLDKRHPDSWDQTEFKYIIEAAVDEIPSLNVQMLKKDKFPVLCCEYCNDFLKPLVQRARGWRDHCPRQERDKWIAFHATCLNHFREVEDLDYDEGVQKQHIMMMIKDLKEQDKLTLPE